tara:strand:+ start:1279 stop:1719 length:441 start_codon:yes stop_codon:yes gene_type:complete
MKKTYKVGWQKYEDVIEQQISSPIVDQLYNAMVRKSEESVIEDLTEEELEQMERLIEQDMSQTSEMINIPESLANEISLATNFDCWIAHTNFNLTESIKNELDQIEGVEMLKIFSRYRFLIGVGRMFNFSDVRQEIESIFKENNQE